MKKKVLIIGIDGCRPDALLAAEVPVINSLIRRGASSLDTQTCRYALSGPGWSSMLTGVWEDKHGVTDNTFAGAQYFRFPHFFWRVKQLMPKATSASVVNWAPINDIVSSAADVSANFGIDEEVAHEACRVLKTYGPDVMFVQFDNVDAVGHTSEFSPDKAEYLAAIRGVDAQVGKVIEVVDDRRAGNDEDWLVILSSDHGGSQNRHGLDIPEHRTVFLILDGPSVEPGAIMEETGVVDVAATAMAHLGLNADPSWGWDGSAVGLSASGG